MIVNYLSQNNKYLQIFRFLNVRIFCFSHCCRVQDQRVGEPENHRSSSRQSAGPAVRHVRGATGSTPTKQQTGQSVPLIGSSQIILLSWPRVSPSSVLNSCCVVCRVSGSPAYGVLLRLVWRQHLLQPVHLRLWPAGHWLEHQHPRPAAGEMTSTSSCCHLTVMKLHLKSVVGASNAHILQA